MNGTPAKRNFLQENSNMNYTMNQEMEIDEYKKRLSKVMQMLSVV